MAGSREGDGAASDGAAPSVAAGERHGFDEVATRLRGVRRSIGLEGEVEPEPEPEVTLDAAVGTSDDVPDGGAAPGVTAPVAGPRDFTSVRRPGVRPATVGPAVLALGWVAFVALVVLAV